MLHEDPRSIAGYIDGERAGAAQPLEIDPLTSNADDISTLFFFDIHK